MKQGTTIAVCIGVLALAAPGAADALTMNECSAKYKAAQTSGSTLKWQDFRKTECASNAAPASAAKASAPAPRTAAPATPPATQPAGAPVFPSGIAPQYQKESAGKGRMHTCLDQYKANKASNGNGGLNWIQKGGGYYSQCNARLKG